MSRAVTPSLSEVVALNPAIWSTKNNKTPEDFSKNSQELVWFACSKCKATYERKAKEVRLHPERCGVCAGKIIITGINDVKSKLPEVLTKWDYDLNNIDPSKVGISFVAYFRCDTCKQSTKRMASAVAKNPHACSVCAGKIIVLGINDLKSQRPSLAAQWSPKNDRTPEEVTLGSGYRAIWICDFSHEWPAEVGTRVKFN